MDNPSNFFNHGENSFHVVVGSGTNDTALLDGFTVRGGNANGASGGKDAGGGMYNDAGSPTVRNVTFISNRAGNFTGNPGSGGGMHNGNGSRPKITNTVFANNLSTGSGGGMLNFQSGPTVTNTIFRNNQANIGGGVSDSFGGSTMINAVFTGNAASSGGGLQSFRNMTTPTTVINSTFSGNSASSGQGGGIFNGFDGLTVVRNSILWNTGAAITSTNGGSSTVTNSTVQGGFSGDGNSNRDPRFANGLRLQTNSPAVNAGDNDSLPADTQDLDGDGDTTEKIPFDPAGNDRIFQNVDASLRNVDMGAYELQAEPTNATPNVKDPPIADQNLEVGGPDFTANLNDFFSDADDDSLTFAAESSDPVFATVTVSGSTLTATPVAAGKTTITVTANDGRGGSVSDMFDATVTVRPTCSDEGIIYVDEAAEADGLGTSWDDAFTDLQDALALARDGECADADQIWVARGTYIPTDGTDRNSTFTLVEGIEIYGGFAGTEAPDFDLETRDFTTNRTILSGDIDGNDETDEGGVVRDTEDINGSNAQNVVTAFEVDGTAVLDGFIVTGGRANGDSGCIFVDLADSACGGGMEALYASPALRNLEFIGNSALLRGGGMFISTDSAPTLTDVRIESNVAVTSGGGVDNISSGDPTFTNVAFVGNSTTGSGGGANFSSPMAEVSFDNVLFSGNSAGGDGGGIHTFAESASFTNATFSGNRAGNGGGVYNFATTASFENSILWNNAASLPSGNEFANGNESASTTFSHSLAKNENPTGTGNLDGAKLRNDPRFVAPENPTEAPATAGDYHLENTSRAINRGSNDFVTATTDLDGNARIVGDAVDIGAYESQNEPAGAVASLDPASLAFGNQRAGTPSDAKKITVENTGNAPLDIGSVSSSDGQFEVDAADCTSGGDIGLDGTCEISVTFTPDSVGGETAELSISSNASVSQQTAALSGTGTAPVATLAPEEGVDFGEQRVGVESGAETITLTNSGTAPLKVKDVSLSDDSAGFFISDNGCEDAVEEVILEPGTSESPAGGCAVEVTFAPNSSGAKTANLLFDTDASDEPQSVALSGDGVEPVASISAEALDFMNQRVGGPSEPKVVTLSNTGTAPLDVGSVGITGEDASQFSFDGTDCTDETVAVDDECDISVTFTPDSVGGKSATLAITDDATGSPRRVALTGAGVSPEASVGPSGVAFGNQRVGTVSPARTLTLTNTGSADMTVESATVAGANAGQFRKPSDACSSSVLAPSESCKVSVRFAPGSAGLKVASLEIRTDASEAPATANLRGKGSSSAPPQTLNPNRCTIVGTPANDILRGTPGRGIICGRGGNDIIRGMGGNDIIRGGAGNDILHGGPGNDRLFGQAGNDVLRGGPGRDLLVGGPGRDSVRQ